ncbi:MAG: polysaccharide biosynthesis/export family protein [Akkermansiaceae bacterium]|nr:polysaccharide biosynthesis/export family protein [Akkermansiaceae bacterium]
MPQSPASDLTSANSATGRGAVAFKSLLPFDILRVGMHVLRGWPWVALAAGLGGAAAFGFGWKRFTTKYTTQVQIVRRETQNNFQASQLGESFRPRQFNAATVSAMMQSGPLMEKTGASLKPPMSAADFQRQVIIRPEKNTDLISVAWTTVRSAAYAADAINKYAEQVVDLTRQLQAEEAKELLTFISSQMERTEGELVAAQKEMTAFSKESGLYNADKETESYLKQIGELELKIETARIERETIDYRMAQIEKELAKQNPAMQRLKDARDKLAELKTQFTGQHPLVVEQQAKVKVLEQSAIPVPDADATAAFQSTGNTVANSLYLNVITLRGQKESLQQQVDSLQTFLDQIKKKLDTIPDKSLAQARIKARTAALEETRNLLGGRQREAQLFAEQALGYYRLFAPATADAVQVSSRTMKLTLVSLAGLLLAAGAMVAWRALRGAMNDQIISPSDVRRLARAPLVAALPDESAMDSAALARWRFAAWAKVVRGVPAASEGALIVGLLSAADGEGKSTWLRHLGRAALDRGLKVLAITHGVGTGPPSASVPLATGLANPGKILTHLQTAQPAAVEINADDSWQWTAAARHQWCEALSVWSREPGLVVLVELPPAAELDSLLLAETLPAVLWLSDSGRHRREQVTGIMDTIRQSGVTVIGALLNRVPPIFQKLPDLAKFGLCLALTAAVFPLPAPAQEPEPDPPPPVAHGDLPSVVPTRPEPPQESPPEPIVPDDPLMVPPPMEPAQPAPPIPQPKPPVSLAPWQERLTLGPGDLVNLQIFGRKEYTRTEVPVNPDGTLTYLQVHGYRAAGKTIDELREGLTKEVRSYITNAQVVVTPSAYRSKKYFVLGTVIDRGAYTLDRPMTLLEATVRARGIATGLLEQNTVEIADMRRAFIVRDGKKLDVDFTKLFYEGDLTHNLQLQPGDYIYFPSNIVNEVYVLGAVDAPGHTGVTESLTALGAIGIRGGFTQAAWRKKVLIVRGSFDRKQPEVIEVDAAAILAGKAKDVLLQPRDLIYVSEKPWQRASEIADLAMRAFIQTGVATWTGQNMGPFIDQPLLPTLKSR